MKKNGYEITAENATYVVAKNGVTEVFDDLASAVAYVNYQTGVITAHEYVMATMYEGASKERRTLCVKKVWK